jgi:hypothetical protein
MFAFTNSCIPTNKEDILTSNAYGLVAAQPVKITEIPYHVRDDTSVVCAISIREKPQYGFTDDEIYLLAQLLCGDKNKDGDGEYDVDFQKQINYHEISKVFCVIMNRIRDSRFPDTVNEVILAKGQFSVMPRNSKVVPSERALKVTRDWCNAYDKYDRKIQCIPLNHVYFTGNGYTNVTRA